MNRILILIIIVAFLLGCGKKQVIKLPEISHGEISEIRDISPAYIFYDTTQKDSVKLTRSQLISTTNWLVNIDKRLTLRQVIPHVQVLQNKKRNAKMHKNENAKNYFSCNDTGIKSLGFIEFTDIVYLKETKEELFNPQKEMHHENFRLNVLKKFKSHSLSDYPSFIELVVESKDKIHFNDISYFTLSQLGSEISSKINSRTALFLIINSNLSFQDYITIKHNLLKLEIDNLKITNHEIIYN